MSDLIGQRLRAAREKRGLSQAALSERLGFKGHQILATIESGKRKVSAEELLRAMEVLQLDLEYFTDPFRLEGEGRFSWRTSRDASQQELEKFEARAGRWVALYRRLGKGGDIPGSPLRVHLALTERSDFEDVRVCAERLGRAWSLGTVPARVLEQRVRDEFGALVLYVDAPVSISGAACRLPELNVVLINRNEPEGRRNYDLAHEVFHLLTWDIMPPEHREGEIPRSGKANRVEQFADNFASALLMPEQSIRTRWRSRDGQPIHAWLNSTATDFLVTAVALKWRLVHLGLLTQQQASALDDRRLTSNGQPPGKRQMPRLFSREFAERLRKALDAGELSVRRAAALLDMTIEDLADLFRSHDLAVPFEL